MSVSPIFHGSFVIERRYPVPPVRVFAAWTDPELKPRWFRGPPGWELYERSLDAREGGIELLHGRFTGEKAMETRFTARFHHIVPATRLVYIYDMHLDGAHHSASLATVEFLPDGEGTLQRYNGRSPSSTAPRPTGACPRASKAPRPTSIVLKNCLREAGHGTDPVCPPVLLVLPESDRGPARARPAVHAAADQ